MKDFLLFRTFMAHTLIRVFFYLAIILQVLGYFGMTIFSFATQGAMQGITVGVVGFFVLILYIVLLRVFSEMMIVVFKFMTNSNGSIRRCKFFESGEIVDDGGLQSCGPPFQFFAGYLA